MLKMSIEQNAGLESILAILLKQTLPQGFYGISSARYFLLKFRKISSKLLLLFLLYRRLQLYQR